MLTLAAAAMIVAAAAPQQAQGSPARPAPLIALLDEAYDHAMRTGPESASRRGDLRFNDKLYDPSPEGIAAARAVEASLLERARTLDRAGFTDEDHLDADLLVYTIEERQAGARFFPEHTPISSMDGPHIWLPQLSLTIPFEEPRHFADYASRLEAVPAHVRSHIRQMRAGLAAGRVPPRVIFARTVASVEALAGDDVLADPTRSPFYRPFLNRPQDDPAAARARAAIRDGIVPAWRELAAFLRDEYIPACRETLGISQGVDGPAAYDQLIREHTTLSLSAREIHDIGLREVARLRAEMIAVIDETDWPARSTFGPGRDDEKLAAFLKFLREDPRFYFSEATGGAQALLARYRDIAKRIDPELPRLFRTLPRNTYGVREIPRFAAPTSPAAYYYPGSIRSGVPGYFMANTFALDQRPIYGMVSLTIHEAVPGHHFQGAIADELEGVHQLRSINWYTAYGEGWALYAESLGLEMGDSPLPPDLAMAISDPDRLFPPGKPRVPADRRGLYADPYDYFGRLSDEIWRACRLVVDTGIHAMGWSRQQAIDYMLNNTAGTELDTISEVDRYIGWPGQALGYKLGEIKIWQLRRYASRVLGERFDLREFHDQLLSGGPMPLPVLQKRIERYVASRRGS